MAAARARIAALEVELAQLRSDHREAAAARNAVRQLRNTLAIIRSVLRRTTETAETLEDMSMHFAGRFDALVRSGERLWGTQLNEVEDLVRDELLSAGERDGQRLIIAGPSYKLNRQQAPLIGLALHELATNSIKFGALAVREGRLSITWELDSDGALHLAWVEAGVPVVATAPLRTGFGREFIEQALPYQLKAQTMFELRPGGLACFIVLMRDQPVDDPYRGTPLP